MRLIFACQDCGIHYLPPEGLRYGDGSPASAVWCSVCQAVNAALGIQERSEVAALAMFAAVSAMREALAGRLFGVPQERLPDRRPSRPSRTPRGQRRPTGQRGRLG